MTPSREIQSSYDSPYRSMKLDDIKIPKNYSRPVKYLGSAFVGFLVGALVVNTFVKTKVVSKITSDCQDTVYSTGAYAKVECRPDQFLTRSDTTPVWWICRCKGNE
jgi:hypothetical protein